MLKFHMRLYAMSIMAEFGVFVDAYGRRSRTNELKWSRLPLTFGKFILRQILRQTLCLKDNVPDHVKDGTNNFRNQSLKKCIFNASILFIPKLSESRTCL